MNVRIGDSDDLVSSVRSGGAVGRTRTAVSDLGGATEGARPHGGVVIRLSPEAQKILARDDVHRDPQDAPPARRGDADPDTDVGDATGKAGTPATTPVAVGRPQSSDASNATGGDAGNSSEKGGQGKGPDGADGKQRGHVPGAPRPLSDEDKRVVAELSARDTAVHAHEAAHMAAAGGLGGSASYSYETGPDGRRYAVGGEVPVSIRPGRTPQETIANAQTVRSAAMAPADPSAQDMAVAAQAAQMEAEARQELMARKSDDADGGRDAGASGAKAVGGDTGSGDSGDADVAASAATDRATSSAAPAATAGRTGQAHGAAVAAARGERHVPRDREGREKAGASTEKAAPRDVQHDQMMVFSALKAERKSTAGGVAGGHQHFGSGAGCALCSRAAARYA